LAAPKDADGEICLRSRTNLGVETENSGNENENRQKK
jgi:hypothetical protein